MNTSIRNILREGLILEASKKEILIQKVGFDEESAEILDRLCGPLSVWMSNKIIDYYMSYYGRMTQELSPVELRKVTIQKMIDDRRIKTERQTITSIMDWIRVGLNGNLGSNKELTYQNLYDASKKWHDELDMGQGDINYVEDNPIILDFRDGNGNGFYWADLETSNSPEECERMGHCGRSGAGMIYSLRQVVPLNDKFKLNKSILTAAIGTNGIIYQMKGGKNSKPEAKYHEYIYPLLFLKKGDGYFINGFGSEYDSASDFKLTDFSENVIREIYAKRPELFNTRSLKKKLFSMGLIKELPEEYISLEIDPSMVNRYVDGDFTVRKNNNIHIGLFETILAGDTWDLWDNYDADWKSALQYHADSDSLSMIDEKLREMAANSGVEYDEELSLEEKLEEYDSDMEIIHAIQNSVNNAESDSYVDYLYKLLKEALEELGSVERMDDTGVVLRVNMTNYLDDLEEDVYEEISDRCDEDLECMFDEMIGDWIDKPDFRQDDRFTPDVDDRYFNELLQDDLSSIRVDESKVRIKNLLREVFVPKVVNEVSDEVYDLINTKYSNSRIVMSHEPEINFRVKTQQEKGYKPSGLWYGIGPSWIEFVRSEMPARETEHVFKIDIDESKMIIIRNYEQLIAFEKEYSISIDGISGYLYIDWERVARDYSGIEIAPYIYEARMKHMWYYGWDIASGCIWGDGVIKHISKIS